MPTTYAPSKSCARVLGCLLAFSSIGLNGCSQQPEITTYTAPKSEEAGRPFSCKVPKDWELAPNKQFIKLTFRCAAGTEVSVSSLPTTGDQFTLMNVNRWRRQVSLPPVEKLEDVGKAELGNVEGKLVKLAGSDEAVTGAIVERSGETWFFKMKGPSAAVTDQADAFVSFLKSVEFFEQSRS